MKNIFDSAITSPFDMRDYTIVADTQFPETFALLTVPVKNQGLQSTCVAHALASLVEYHHQRQHGWYTRFSTEFIYGLREDGYYVGDGMIPRQALQTLLNYGDVYDEDCCGNHGYVAAMNRVSKDVERLKELAYPHRISGYFKIKSAEELKTALMKHGVVIVTMKMYQGDTLKKDVYTYPANAKKRGLHCVFIYGWDERGWLVQNSWGPLYGWDGRFVVPFDFKFDEMWGATDEITEDIQKPKRNRWLDILYKIINKIVNLIRK